MSCLATLLHEIRIQTSILAMKKFHIEQANAEEIEDRPGDVKLKQMNQYTFVGETGTYPARKPLPYM